MKRIAIATFLLALTGCGGSSGPKTYAVEGRVTLSGGDPAALAGHYIETTKQGSAETAFAVIEPDGRFKLESLHAGNLAKGATEGDYQVRLVLSDDIINANRKPAKSPVAAKYLQFKSSGLSLHVPPKGDVALMVTAK